MDQNNSLPPYAQGLASPQVKTNYLRYNYDLNSLYERVFSFLHLASHFLFADLKNSARYQIILV